MFGNVRAQRAQAACTAKEATKVYIVLIFNEYSTGSAGLRQELKPPSPPGRFSSKPSTGKRAHPTSRANTSSAGSIATSEEARGWRWRATGRGPQN